jgi:hypothetical protein
VPAFGGHTICHCEAFRKESRGNLFFLKKKVRKTYHLKNRLPRLNAGGVQARNDKKGPESLSLRGFPKGSRGNLK